MAEGHMTLSEFEEAVFVQEIPTLLSPQGGTGPT